MTSNSNKYVRDQQDIVRWIDNKLGSNELWGGRQAAHTLTREILTELEVCFQELEAHIKLKIILAMVHLSPKTLKAWEGLLLNLIEIARRDPDDWVETISDICRQYPNHGLIQCCSPKPDSYFFAFQMELEKIVDEKIAIYGSDFCSQVPPNFEFMHESLLNDIIPDASKKVQHFALRQAKVSRSTKLLEEVKKAAEQQNCPSSKKNNGLVSSFPIKIRSTAKRLDNSLPMRGFVTSTNTLKMSSGFTNESKKYQQRNLLKRTGGALLIDIAELPNPNRRKRNVEALTIKTSSPEKSHIEIDSATNSKSEAQNEGNKQADQDINTYNYNDEFKPSENNRAMQNSSEDQMQAAFQEEHPPSNKSTSFFSNPLPTMAFVPNTSFLPASHQNPHVHQFYPQPQYNQQQQPEQSTSFPSASQSDSNFMPGFIQSQNQPASSNFLGPSMDILALQQFEGLLKDANKLTPMTRNLIISFLSGNKVNPLQEKLGHVITLPFSESIEFEPTPIGIGVNASLVEVYFQMDYRTGEWKRLRKTRELRPEELNQYGHLFGSRQEKVRQMPGINSLVPSSSGLLNHIWNLGETNEALSHSMTVPNTFVVNP